MIAVKKVTHIDKLLKKTFVKHNAHQQIIGVDIEQFNDPEFSDINDQESIIESFNFQIEIIKRMCVNNINGQEDSTNIQYEFDFPSKQTLIDIMTNLYNAIATKLIPIEFLINPLIFLFLDKILLNNVFQKDELMVNKVCIIYMSLSLYDYFELMDSVINKYPIFLLNSTNGQISIGETEEEIFIITISNLLLDEESRKKLITLEIHIIIFKTLIQSSILSPLFQSCLDYISNLINFLDSEEKDSQFFKDLIMFLIESIISNFPVKLIQDSSYENDNNHNEDKAITILISELKILSILYDKLIEFGLYSGIENCINILFNLANSNHKYFCISEHLFEIMRLTAIYTKNKFSLFSDPSFLNSFFNIYKNSSIKAKIQGVDLLIILSPLISENISFFQTVLQDFQDSTSDSNFQFWEHICSFAISILSNAPLSKKRELMNQTLIEIIINALETRVFLNPILNLLISLKQSDPDFWDEFLIENDIISTVSDFKDNDFDETNQYDQESIRLIRILTDE